MPATPQNDAGRVIEPPVCVPIAPRHIPQATAAAEPLDEPPGRPLEVPGIPRGGRVDPGVRRRDRLAHDHRPGLAEPGDDLGVRLGDPIAPSASHPQAVGSPFDVDDVLDPDRDAVERPAILAGSQFRIERAGLLDRPSRSSTTQAWTFGSHSSIWSRQA